MKKVDHPLFFVGNYCIQLRCNSEVGRGSVIILATLP